MIGPSKPIFWQADEDFYPEEFWPEDWEPGAIAMNLFTQKPWLLELIGRHKSI